jgi:hypothetical protein
MARFGSKPALHSTSVPNPDRTCHHPNGVPGTKASNAAQNCERQLSCSCSISCFRAVKNQMTYFATYLARWKMVAATPPPDACGSVKRSSSPAMTKERLLFFPSQFGNVARSI